MGDYWKELSKARVYNYKCECDNITKRNLEGLGWDGEVWDERPMTWPCEECGKDAVYAGFDPIRSGYVVKTTFEKNGRIGYRYGDGKVISKTKDHLVRTGKVVSQLSPSYKKAMENRVDHSAKEFFKKIKK